MLAIGLALTVLLLGSGAAIFVAFGAGSIILTSFYAGMSFQTLAQQWFSAVNKPTLLAIPFFILAGNLLTFTGPSKALVDFVRSLIGHFKGGLAVAAVLACTLFAAVCGSSLATALAVGTMMVPLMVQAGYPRVFSTALVCCAGTLGILIPPSISMIILADVTGASTGKLFMAGIVPGLMTSAFLIITALIVLRGREVGVDKKSNWPTRGKLFFKAIPAIFMPLFILGGIYGGVFTPTEAAAASVIYALIIGWFVYRELNPKTLWHATFDTIRASSAIYFIIGTAVLMGIVLSYMKIPQAITNTITELNVSAFQFQLIVMVLFIFLGMILEAVVIHYVCLPLLLPVIAMLDINLLPFCIMLVMNTMIGGITPPVAVVLYGGCSALGESPLPVFKESLPFLAAEVIAMIIVIVWPGLSTWLPGLMLK